MYSLDTCDRVLGFILRQIGMGHTHQLVLAIARWHRVELHLLLSEIFIQLAPLWWAFPRFIATQTQWTFFRNPALRLVFSSPLFNSYAMDQRHPSLVPLILFLSKLIRRSHRMCTVILHVGFLDVLLSVCQSYDFKSAKILKSGDGGYSSNNKHVLIAANVALLDIMGYPENRSLILNHPIKDVWPKHRLPSRRDSFATTSEDILLDPDKGVPFEDHSLYITLSM